MPEELEAEEDESKWRLKSPPDWCVTHEDLAGWYSSYTNDCIREINRLNKELKVKSDHISSRIVDI